MSLKDALSEETCYTNIEAASQEEALHIIASKMYERGIVKKDYERHVIQREKEYPTGLPLNGYKVAIPHTDSKYVNKTTICVASLNQPIDFRVMGGREEKTSVSVIMMMAIKEPHAQLETLQELIHLVQDDKMMKELVAAKDGKEIYHKIISCIS